MVHVCWCDVCGRQRLTWRGQFFISVSPRAGLEGYSSFQASMVLAPLCLLLLSRARKTHCCVFFWELCSLSSVAEALNPSDHSVFLSASPGCSAVSAPFIHTLFPRVVLVPVLKVSWLEQVWVYLRTEVFLNVIIIVVCMCVHCVCVGTCMCVYCVCMCWHMCGGYMCVCLGMYVCIHVCVWTHLCMRHMYVCVSTCTEIRGQHCGLGSLLPFSHVFGDQAQVTDVCSRCPFPLSLSLALDFEFCCIDLCLSCQLSHPHDNCFHFSAL